MLSTEVSHLRASYTWKVDIFIPIIQIRFCSSQNLGTCPELMPELHLKPLSVWNQTPCLSHDQEFLTGNPLIRAELKRKGKIWISMLVFTSIVIQYVWDGTHNSKALTSFLGYYKGHLNMQTYIMLPTQGTETYFLTAVILGIFSL